MDIKGFFSEFGWFIWGLVGIGLLWFVTGGANNYSAREPYIKPLAPIDSGETYGAYYAPSASTGSERLNLPQAPANFVRSATERIRDFLMRSEAPRRVYSASPLSGFLVFDGTAGAKESGTGEYIRIIASDKAASPISLAGLRIQSTGVDGIAIPAAANLFILGSAPARQTISLPPGGRALIATGKSPVGASFRVNQCSGYLGQSGSYFPDLRQECPDPLDELRAAGPYHESSCRAFVGGLPKCRSHSGDFPDSISTACKSFVTEKLTYNSCAARHLGGEEFYKNEWRIFLEQDDELWKNSRETIRILDGAGRSVDTLEY